MNKNTLGEFLLTKFAGAVLHVKENTPIIPGTIGELVDPLDDLLCEATRFRFREKIPLERVREILIEYYTGIQWKNSIHMSDQGPIMGDVWPAEADTVLGIYGRYEKDERGAETNILLVALCPVIS